ncbi:uncharacterized protein UTRI_06239 [Ustilago trichophora]|uniref:Uncharacterized protein n=1 Tax=Ustilago trichophora TaxID=86804 RepID=A0A5C3EG97_9BASI|nr:uncharacterized protein UTRI_06239 [Ustilago trichophora]
MFKIIKGLLSLTLMWLIAQPIKAFIIPDGEIIWRAGQPTRYFQSNIVTLIRLGYEREIQAGRPVHAMLGGAEQAFTDHVMQQNRFGQHRDITGLEFNQWYGRWASEQARAHAVAASARNPGRQH